MTSVTISTPSLLNSLMPLPPRFGSVLRFPHCFTSVIAICALMALAGCGSLPKAGPSAEEIAEEGASVLPFNLVDLSASVIEALRQRPQESFAALFGEDAEPPKLRIGLGDGLSVSLWETGTNPLFASGSPSLTGGSRGMALPEQLIDEDGGIAIPFAGRISAAGHTSQEVQASIERALTGKTQSPQALVSMTRSASNAVTLLGEAVGGARVPLTVRGERVLDALAIAGGSRLPVHETRVQLTRGGRAASLPLSRLLRSPEDNVRLQPGDELVLTRYVESFSAFGATGRNALVSFEAERINLVEAIARAGGLLDQRADSAGVFLFRYEPVVVATALAGSGVTPQDAGERVPVIYRLDLTRAGSYFIAQDFELRDRDVLYVASAPANELQKFLILLGLVTQPAINGALLGQATK